MAIGVAVLGAGRWGTHLIRNFLAEPRAVVRAIADPTLDPERLRRSFSEAVDWSAIEITADWRSALSVPGVEAVVVATPAVTHWELVRAALLQGYHVLAEKPLTLAVAEAWDLWALAQQVQRQLVIDHTYLFHPALEAAQQAIAAGAIGTIRYGYASRTHLGPVRQDVDALWDLAIHDIAMLNTCLGATPCRVQAQGQVWLQPQLSLPGRSPSASAGLADTVWGLLAYPNGIHVQLHFSWLNPDKQRRLTLVGDRGAIVFDELAAEPLVLYQGQLDPDGPKFVPNGLQRQVLPLSPEEPLGRVCRHFLDCVENDQPSDRSSGQVGAELVAVLTALSQSMERQGEWEVVPSSYPFASASTVRSDRSSKGM